VSGLPGSASETLKRLLADDFKDAAELKRALMAEAMRADALTNALSVAVSRMEVASADWGIAYATGSDKLTYAEDMWNWAREARKSLDDASARKCI